MKKSIFFTLSILTTSFSLSGMHGKKSIISIFQFNNNKSYQNEIAGTNKIIAWKTIGKYTLQAAQKAVLEEITPNQTVAHIATGVTDGLLHGLCSSFCFGPKKTVLFDGVQTGMQRGAFVFGGEILILASKELLNCIEQGSKNENLPKPVQNLYTHITSAQKIASEYHQKLESNYPTPTQVVSSIGRKVTRDVAAYSIYALMCKAGGGNVKISSFYKLAGYGV